MADVSFKRKFPQISFKTNILRLKLIYLIITIHGSVTNEKFGSLSAVLNTLKACLKHLKSVS